MHFECVGVCMRTCTLVCVCVIFPNFIHGSEYAHKEYGSVDLTSYIVQVGF